MMTVYKYELTEKNIQTLRMPERSEILHFGHQDGKLFLWALVNTELTIDCTVVVELRHTGERASNGLCGRHYIGTVLDYKGNLVIHAFVVARMRFDTEGK